MITDRHLIEQLSSSLMGENTGEVRPTSLQLRMVQRISASLVGKGLTEKLSKMSHDSYTNGYSGHLSI